jgi:multiple sugar transport system substrate-binding protein
MNNSKSHGSLSRRTLLAGIAATAAAGAAKGAVAAPPSLIQTQTVRYYQFMNSVEDQPIWQGGIDRFQELNPDITIAHEFAPWESYWDNLTTAVASGTAADAILMVTMYVQQYGLVGAIQSLGPYAAEDPSANLDDQWEGVQRANTINDDGPYQLMYDLSTRAVFFNRDLFREAGVPDPTEMLPDYWTFDQFRDAAIALTGNGRWGIGNGPTFDSAILHPLMQSNGGGIVNEDNTESLLDRPESIEMMELWAELYQTHDVAPSAQQASDIPLFESGQVAMQITNPERVLRYRERITGFEWDVAPLPVSTKTKEKRNSLDGGGLSMGATATNPEATWKFINYYMSAENLKIMIGETGRGIPGRPSIADSLLRDDLPPQHMQLFIDGVDHARTWVTTNFTETINALQPIGEAIEGNRDMVQTLTEAKPKIDALLADL